MRISSCVGSFDFMLFMFQKKEDRRAAVYLLLFTTSVKRLLCNSFYIRVRTTLRIRLRTTLRTTLPKGCENPAKTLRMKIPSFMRSNVICADHLFRLSRLLLCFHQRCECLVILASVRVPAFLSMKAKLVEIFEPKLLQPVTQSAGWH